MVVQEHSTRGISDLFLFIKLTEALLEVINRYENNYLNTANETIQIIDKIGISSIKVQLDTFHMNIEESSMSDAILKSGEKLGYIHVADNTRLAVGTGSIDFQKVFDSLIDIGYKGAVSLECLPLPTGEIAARKSLKEINKYF